MAEWWLPRRPARYPVLSAVLTATGLVLFGLLVVVLSVAETDVVSSCSSGPNHWFQNHLGEVELTGGPGSEPACIGHTPLVWTLTALLAVGPLVIWTVLTIRRLRNTADD